jgi:hypothetical protein
MGMLFCLQVIEGVQNGRESMEDEQHARCPLISRTENNVARVKAVLERD